MWRLSFGLSGDAPGGGGRSGLLARGAERVLPKAVDRPVLFVEEVSVRYGQTLAVEHISFTVEAGQIIGLIGPNGAGKTSLLKAVVGLVPVDAGRIRRGGSRTAPTGGVNAAYVSQREAIDWSFPVTTLEVVLMGRTRVVGWLRRPGAVDLDAAWRALDEVGMREQAYRQIGALSGGEQQRVMLARALAQGAELLLLDEPFRGLDVTAQDALVTALRSACARGCAALVATHDLGQAAEMCDQLVLISTTLVARGLPHEVLTADNLRAAYGPQVFIAGDHVIGVGNGS